MNYMQYIVLLIGSEVIGVLLHSPLSFFTHNTKGLIYESPMRIKISSKTFQNANIIHGEAANI